MMNYKQVINCSFTKGDDIKELLVSTKVIQGVTRLLLHVSLENHMIMVKFWRIRRVKYMRHLDFRIMMHIHSTTKIERRMCYKVKFCMLPHMRHSCFRILPHMRYSCFRILSHMRHACFRILPHKRHSCFCILRHMHHSCFRILPQSLLKCHVLA